jgi:hypothetical protein
LHALKESIDCVKNIDRTVISLKSNTNDIKEELNDLAAGRTTIKSIWKTVIRKTPTQDELIRRIETIEKQIEDWQLLRDYLIQFVP